MRVLIVYRSFRETNGCQYLAWDVHQGLNGEVNLLVQAVIFEDWVVLFAIISTDEELCHVVVFSISPFAFASFVTNGR